jgi:hypothetical protein
MLDLTRKRSVIPRAGEGRHRDWEERSTSLLQIAADKQQPNVNSDARLQTILQTSVLIRVRP